MKESKTSSKAEAYGRWVVRWRWPVLIGSLLLAMIAGFGATKLGFDNSYRVFFGPDNPQLLAFEELENTYSKNDNVLFVLDPNEGDAFSQEHLTMVADLTDRAWKLPYARRVDSPTNYQHSYAEEDDLIVEDLVPDPASATDEELAAALATALEQPELRDRLITLAADVSGVNVTLELPGKSPFEVTEVATAARELAAEFEANHDVKIHLTGVAMLNNAFAENSQKDMMTLTPIMFGLMILASVIFLRSILGAVGTLFVIGLSTATGLGLAGWMGVSFTPPSSVAPTMIMTLAVADSIHVLVTILTAMAAGMTKRDAIVESLRVNLQPVVITSLTTAIGFLSLNFSDSPPFRDLGNIAAMGVTAALFYSVTFFPALIAIMPMRRPKAAEEKSRMVEGISSFVLRSHRPLMWGSIVVVVAICAFIPRNQLDDQFIQYFDDRVEFRVDSDFATDNLTGLYQIDFSLGTESTGGISDPEYLQKLDEFDQWARKQEGVIQVSSLAHTMKRLNKNLHADDESYFRIPESRELAAQYLLLYEMSLPYGLDLNNQININKSHSKLSLTLDDMSASRMRELAGDAEAWLHDNTPESMFSHGIGPIIMFAYISKRNVESMLLGTFVALVAISLCLIFALRSLRYGLLSLIPNLIPALLTFGLWGLTVREVNLGLANVMAMSLGIVADDTIHFLSKYLRGRRERGLEAEGAIQYAFRSVGKALIVTSVVLIIGFAVMTQSAFALNSNMGWFTVITIAVALIADFLLLPGILMALDKKKDAARVTRTERTPEPSPAS